MDHPPAIAALTQGTTWAETWAMYHALSPGTARDDAIADLRAGIATLLISRELALAIDAMGCLRRLQALGAQAAEAADRLLQAEEDPDDPLSLRMRAVAANVAAGSSAASTEIKARAEVDRRVRALIDRAADIRDMSGMTWQDKIRTIADLALTDGELALAADLYQRSTPRELTAPGGLARQAQAVARIEAALRAGDVPETS